MKNFSSSALSIFSYPKVNLALDILRRNSSGYHKIQTVFHELAEPFDEITIEPAGDGILEVRCDNPEVPVDETNTVFKAARLLQKHARKAGGARIFIKKRIPLMSGFGGGASNAVAVLKTLCHLWGVFCCIGTSEHSTYHDPNCLLRRLVLQIGMDCAFFFYGGTALGTHYGEKIEPLPQIPSSLKISILETGIKISSYEAYNFIDLNRCGKNIQKTSQLIEGLHEENPQKILENLHNDFEEFVFEKYPQLLALKCKKELSSNRRVLLSGSGGALYSGGNPKNASHFTPTSSPPCLPTGRQGSQARRLRNEAIKIKFY